MSQKDQPLDQTAGCDDWMESHDIVLEERPCVTFFFFLIKSLNVHVILPPLDPWLPGCSLYLHDNDFKGTSCELP